MGFSSVKYKMQKGCCYLLSYSKGKPGPFIEPAIAWYVVETIIVIFAVVLMTDLNLLKVEAHPLLYTSPSLADINLGWMYQRFLLSTVLWRPS